LPAKEIFSGYDVLFEEFLKIFASQPATLVLWKWSFLSGKTKCFCRI